MVTGEGDRAITDGEATSGGDVTSGSDNRDTTGGVEGTSTDEYIIDLVTGTMVGVSLAAVDHMVLRGDSCCVEKVFEQAIEKDFIFT